MGAGQIRRTVEADDGLAGAGRAAHTARAGEGSSDESRLLRMEEGHPRFDGPGQNRLEKGFGDLLHGEQGGLRGHGEYRLGDKGSDRRRWRYGLEQRLRPGHHKIDLLLRESLAVLADRGQQLLLSEDSDVAVDDLIETVVPGHGEDNSDLTGREPDLCEDCNRVFGEVDERAHLVGDVGLVALEATVGD